MPVSFDTYLPSYEELKVPEVEISFPLLKSASVHMAKYCDNSYKEFMLCKSEYKKDLRPCLNEGKEVTRCSLEFLHKVKGNCNEVFSAYWNCIDRKRKNQIKLCRRYQDAMDQCFKEKIGVSRPELGYFSRMRVHDTPRPKPEEEGVLPPPAPVTTAANREPRQKIYKTGVVHDAF